MKYAPLESLDNFSYHFTFLKNKSVWQKKEVGRGENEAICIVVYLITGQIKSILSVSGGKGLN